jgi:alpha-beta hydrolase superfamily lysophospholipase
MFETFQLKSCEDELAGYRWEVGEPKAVVCLIHGLGEYSGMYSRIGVTFNVRQISLMCIDLRGHGLSPGTRGDTGARGTVRKDVDNMLAYARERYEGLPIILCGQSLGGNIVMDYRLRGELSEVPVGFIATSPWLTLVDRMNAFNHWMVRTLSVIKPDLGIRAKRLETEEGRAADIRRNQAGKVTHQLISARTLCDTEKVAEALIGGRIEDCFGGGKKPLIIMQGTGDTMCSMDGAQRAADADKGDCQLILWEGYEHRLFSGDGESNGSEVIEKMADCVLSLAGV